MKTGHLLVVAGCLVVICAMFSGVVSALSQEEASASVFWQPQAPLPGSTATATIFFINNSPDTLTIERVGLHFDWMASGFLGLTLSNPVTVPSQGTHTFDPMLISIPVNVTLGFHTYYVGIDGVQGESTALSWDSTELMILIGTGGSSQETYNTLKTQISADLSSANYKSPEAKSLKNQAQTKFDQALELAKEENWAAAIAALQGASSLLAQADTAEQNYKPSFWDQYLLIIIVGVVAAVVVAILLVLLMVRRRRKQPQPEPAAPTPPPPVEQPSYDI
ncbi:hypothetical protein G4O51_10800 [Candidatus Bathyarchaeota archaeon A05DMB-2]|nr:hypothetical protein [Candidatus Bathyarchaeota archaeon A05DMB-2]